jgi:hypothetical protein
MCRRFGIQKQAESAVFLPLGLQMPSESEHLNCVGFDRKGFLCEKFLAVRNNKWKALSNRLKEIFLFNFN